MQFQRILIATAIGVGVVSMLWVAIKLLLQQHVPNGLRPKPGEVYLFDYVIVGGGTAGSVVAALLAKYSNKTVLLIEAGSTFGLLSKIPLLTTFQQKGLNDWAFKSVRQRHSSRGLENEQQCLPRGKGLGGSAQLNYMLHFDGNQQDFEHWASVLNLSEWRWQSAKPFLEAGKAKPYEMLEIQPHYSKITEALANAELEFSARPWLFRRPKYNVKNGLRHSVLQRFLHPVQHSPNLRIMTEAFAKRIDLLNGKDGRSQARALLVGLKKNGKTFKVRIGRELIIAAGAYQSPQLLMVSGIGDKAALSGVNIKCQKHHPAVGRNLHDHLNVPLFVSIDVAGASLNQRTLLDPITWLNYLTTGGGHFGNFGVVGHVDSRGTDRFGLTFFAAGAIDEAALMSVSNFKQAHFRALFPLHHNTSQEGFVLISTCFQPQSRGTIALSTPNIHDPAHIDPNYLAEQADVECTIKAMRAAVELVESDAFASLHPRIHWPKIPECHAFFGLDIQLNQPSDLYLECLIRHVGLTSHHPGGTCAMGTRPDHSVVDAQFRVHGVAGLRVIDASVLPTPVSGNPNSIVVGMAVRGATMLLNDEAAARA